MKIYTNYTITRRDKEWIGDSVIRVLKELRHPKIIAVVPRIIRAFGQTGWEVTEVDLIIETNDGLEEIPSRSSICD